MTPLFGFNEVAAIGFFFFMLGATFGAVVIGDLRIRRAVEWEDDDGEGNLR